MCDCNGKKKNTQADMEPAGKRPGVNPPPGIRSNTQRPKEQPSSSISPDKARQILEDGTVNGKPLTDAQRRMFGAAASRGKGMNSDSGQAGGYLTNSGAVEGNDRGGERLSDTEADGYQACQSCDSTGNCEACGGSGELDDGKECSACKGSGACPDCGGVGLIQKSFQSKGKPPMAEENDVEEPDGETEEEDTPTDAAVEPEEPATPDLPEDSDPAIESKDSVDEPFEPDPTNPAVGKASSSEPFNPKPSAKFAAALYGHYKAAMDYIDHGLRDMDNPGMRSHMEGHKEFLSKAMEHVAAGLAEHHPDHDMDSLMKALEVDNTTGNDPNLAGESGMVTAGEVPPMNEGGAIPPQMGTQQPDAMPNDVPADPFAGQETPDEEAQEMYPTPGVQEEGFAYEPQDKPGQEPYDKGDMDMGGSGIPDSDADTEEILERYRHPKNGKWMTQKHKVKKSFLKYVKFRIAKDGKKYLVKDLTDMGNPAELDKGKKKPKEGDGAYIEGSAHSTMLDEGEKPAPYNKALAGDVQSAGYFLADLSADVEVAKAYRNMAKGHAQRLGAVAKELTNAGKLQRNGGGGRALSQTGHVQSNSGGGEALSESGKPQRDGRSRQQVVGSGTPQGLNDKRPPYNSGKKAPTKDVAREVVEEEFASLKRMFSQLTGKN